MLGRYSGRSDVVFGVTVAGRPPELAGVETMVGMFINTLPLRVVVDESSQLVPWLLRLQDRLVELRRFESVPLARIQGWSEVPPGTPLFESIVTVQNLPFVEALRERADRLGVESPRFLERTHYPITVTALPGTRLADQDRLRRAAVRGRRDRTCPRAPRGPAPGDGRRPGAAARRPALDARPRARASHRALEPPLAELALGPIPDLDGLDERELDLLIDRLG